MELNVKSGHPEKQRTACIVIGVFEPRRLSTVGEKLDTVSGGFISNLLRRGDLEGKLGQVLLLHSVPNTLADRVLLIGCGKERDFGDRQFRKVITQSVKTLNETGSMEAVSFLTEMNVKGKNAQWNIIQAIQTTENCLYEYTEYKSKKCGTRRPLRRLTYTVCSRKDLSIGETALTQGLAIAKGTALTRDLGNCPPNICTPEYLAKTAQSLAKTHEKIQCTVLEKKQIEELKMGLFLSVNQGSTSKPKLITLEYNGGKKGQAPIVLIGKGITFDTGGNSLKAPTSMVGMKFDMCGAGTVLGIMQTLGLMDLPLNVIGVIPTCENMPGPNATRPDDVYTAMSGLTVEIINTDAEGRLILADAMTYCERFEPETVIDIATLTGACMRALGQHACGLFSNHNPLVNDLLHAGQASGDRAWQLPLWEEYQDDLHSEVADMANSGKPEGGAISAAVFLSNFAKKFHWAHLDVAGVACQYTGRHKGATGRPVPLLAQYLIERCAPKDSKKN